MEKSKRRALTISGTDPKVLAAISKLAKADGRSVSNYINLVLAKHVEQSGQRAGGAAA